MKNVWDRKPADMTNENFEKVLQSLKDGNIIAAIKDWKNFNVTGLLESKNAIDEICEDIKQGASQIRVEITKVIFTDKTEQHFNGGNCSIFEGKFLKIGNTYLNLDNVFSFETMEEAEAKTKFLEGL